MLPNFLSFQGFKVLFITSASECESLEATAQFDFVARSDRELSLRKGETVTLYSQVSNDWWRGSVNSKEGLIPDKYILIKMKWVNFVPKYFSW